MILKWTKRFLLLAALGIFLGVASYVKAQSCDSSCPSGDQQCLGDQIKDCNNKIASLQGQANTLSNQIAQFNIQIQLTTLKISQTQEQIKLLGGRIDQLETSLGSLSNAFSERAVQTYKMYRSGEPIFLFLDANSLSDVVSSYHYLAKIEEADRNLLLRLQKAQNIYVDQKSQQEILAKQLNDQQTQLNVQKAAKNQLLSQTRGSEARYQQLLAQAQAELAALSNFASSVGISLIPHQDLSDEWGKYYNQRDSNWGNVLVNGQASGCRNGPCTLASIGCLATSYAMMVTHFGGSIDPAGVATNPANFYLTTADFNNPGSSANGHGASRIDNPSTQQLADTLNSGASIIAGLSMNGGPYPNHYSDHWVVLRSVDGDSFKINDPLYPGAMNVSLKDHYSGWAIIQAIVYR